MFMSSYSLKIHVTQIKTRKMEMGNLLRNNTHIMKPNCTQHGCNFLYYIFHCFLVLAMPILILISLSDVNAIYQNEM